MGVLVVGMHRSGTSALARTVNLLGAALPKDVLGPSANNPLGHWEPRVSYELHNEILASIGSSWSALAPIPEDWFQTAAAEAYAQRFANFLREEFSDERMFVLKDPRLCLLAPLWARAFVLAEMDFRVLIPLRPPIEVARSLNARNKMPISQGQLVWLRNVLQGERLTRDMPRCFLSYARLLDDWRHVMQDVGEAVDLSWPSWTPEAEVEIDGFISPEHRHQVADGSDAAPAWVTDSWQALLDLIDAPNDPATLSRLDDIRQAFDTASLVFTEVLDDLEAAPRPDEAAQERHETTKRKLADAREVLGAAEGNLRELGHRHETSKTKLAEARETLAETRDALLEMSGRHEASKTKLAEAREAQAATRADLDEMTLRHETSKRKLAEARETLTETREAFSEMSGRHETSKRKLAEARQALANAVASFSELNTRYEANKQKLFVARQDFEAALQKLADSERKAVHAATEAKARLQDAREKLSVLQEELATAKASHETSKRKLMEARAHIASLKAASSTLVAQDDG